MLVAPRSDPFRWRRFSETKFKTLISRTKMTTFHNEKRKQSHGDGILVSTSVRSSRCGQATWAIQSEGKVA